MKQTASVHRLNPLLNTNGRSKVTLWVIFRIVPPHPVRQLMDRPLPKGERWRTEALPVLICTLKNPRWSTLSRNQNH